MTKLKTTGKYILDKKGNPKEETDLIVWAKWFETADRKVKEDWINGVRISTIFLGLDHNFYGKGKPTLYETMVFGGKFDGEQMRYSTKKEAEKGHKEMIKKVL